MEKEKLIGVVIAYNPNITELSHNIQTYIHHLDQLIIVLNSEVDVTNILSNSKIEIIKNTENLGIAKPLNQAAQYAIENRYNWLLTMDQDSYFIDDLFFNTFNCSEKSDIAIFSPIHVSNKEINFSKPEKTIYVNYTMTSGNLLNLSIWQELNGFCEKLFIDEVDTEFCFKCIVNNYKIAIFSNIPLIHNLGTLEYKINIPFLNRKLMFNIHSANRYYYISRNSFYLFKIYVLKLPIISINRFYYGFIKKNFLTLIFSQNRREIITNIIKGIGHFIIGRYGSI